MPCVACLAFSHLSHSTHLHLVIGFTLLLFRFAVPPFGDESQWIILWHGTRNLAVRDVLVRQTQMSEPTGGNVVQELLISSRHVFDAPGELG